MDRFRDLDAKVHEALYPNVALAVRGRGDIPTHWLDVGRMVEIPHYSTDLGAWDMVSEQRPSWRWMQLDGDNCVTVTLFGAQPHADPRNRYSLRAVVTAFEVVGHAAYALGRARCVIKWANNG